MRKTKKNAAVVDANVEAPVVETVTFEEPTAEELEEIAADMNAGDVDPDEVHADTGTEEPSVDEQVEDAELEDQEQSDEPQATLEELIANELEDKATIEETREIIAGAFDDRAAFQRAKDSDNETIHRSLNKSRAKLIQEKAVACLLATHTAPDFITDSMHQGSAYNVYAADKLCDIVGALNGDVLHNAINIAVMKSMFAFRAAGEQFTGEMAKGAASKNIRIQGSVAKLLVRHTVSPGTAPTQSSSTMQALQTLGIVRNRGSQKYPVYELTDSPQTKRMEIACAA